MSMYLQHQMISLTIKRGLWFYPKLYKLHQKQTDIICPDTVPIYYLLKCCCR